MYCQEDRVACLIADPAPAFYTTIPRWLVCQDIHLCSYWNTIFARSGKTAVTFEQMM